MITTILVAALINPDLGLDLKLCLDQPFLAKNQLEITKSVENREPQPTDQSRLFRIVDVGNKFTCKLLVAVKSSPFPEKTVSHYNAGAEPHMRKFASGFATGLDMDTQEGDTNVIGIRGVHEYMELSLGPTSTMNAKGFEIDNPLDLVACRQIVEKISRHVFSRLMALHTFESGFIKCGSTNVAARKNSYGDNSYLKLNDWAKARNWQIKQANDGVKVVLTKGDSTLTLVLACFQCQLDDKRIELGDGMIDADGTLFVPEKLDKVIP